MGAVNGVHRRLGPRAVDHRHARHVGDLSRRARRHSGAKTVTTDSLPAWLIDLPRLNLFRIGGLDIRALFMLALAIVVDLPVRAPAT